MGEPLTTDSEDLLVFVDDTGNETFKGHNYFGMGGIMVLARENELLIKPKWRELRSLVHGDAAAPLHAADMTISRNKQHMEAAGQFFRENRFVRFGVVTTADVNVPSSITKRQPVYGLIKKWVAMAAERSPCKSVALIFEASDRADAVLQREFGELQIERSGVAVPVEHCLMPKAAREPGLEVADFVANAVGGMARRYLTGHGGFGQDFRAIFHSVPNHLMRFMFIEGVVGGPDGDHALGVELR